MSDFYYRKTGPEVGVEGGCLFIGWPCRLRDPGTPGYGLTPISLRWEASGDVATIWVAVMDVHGVVSVLDIEDIQFQPDWERPR